MDDKDNLQKMNEKEILREFYKKYGFTGNIVNVYYNSLDNLISRYVEEFNKQSKHNYKINMKIVKSKNVNDSLDAIRTSGSYYDTLMIYFYGKSMMETKLFTFKLIGMITSDNSLPEGEDGYFIIDKIERFITTIESDFSSELNIIKKEDELNEDGIHIKLKFDNDMDISDIQNYSEFIFYYDKDVIKCKSSRLYKNTDRINIISVLFVILNNIVPKELGIGKNKSYELNLKYNLINEEVINIIMEKLTLDITTLEASILAINKCPVYKILEKLNKPKKSDDITLLIRQYEKIAKALIQDFCKESTMLLNSEESIIISKYRIISEICERLTNYYKQDINSRIIYNKESITMKKYDNAGSIISRMLNIALRNHLILDFDIKNFKERMKSAIESINKNIKAGAVTLLTKSDPKGVVHQLSRKNIYDSISNIRKIKVIVDSNSRNMELRQIHKTQTGFICYVQTAENVDTGLIKYIASTAILSCSITTTEIKNVLLPYFEQENVFKSLDSVKNKSDVKLDGTIIELYINSCMVGYCNSRLINKLIELKISHERYSYITYKLDLTYNGRINIYTDNMRLVRPLYNVAHRAIELVDANQLSSMGLKIREPDDSISLYQNANNYQFETNNYLEIHHSYALGLIASMFPFINHAAAIRATFLTSMGTQMISNDPYFRNGLVDQTKFLTYGHKPILTTDIKDLVDEDGFGYKKRTIGFNTFVAYMSLIDNQEDGIIINESLKDIGATIKYSVQRSSNNTYEDYTLTSCSTVTDEKRNFDGITLEYCDKISHNPITGIIKENSIIMPRDNILTKMKTDIHSTIISVPTIVHKKTLITDVLYNKRNNEGTSVSVIGYTYNPIEVGDKMTSRGAQKGVITNIRKYYNCPINEDGLTPLIFINPHGIPSRMTLGHELEGFANTLYLQGGMNKLLNGTPFKQKHMSNLVEKHKQLSTLDKKYKLDKETYCRETGTILKNKIHTVIMNYNLLRHQVDEKAHATGIASIDHIYHQPIQGLSHNGGIRLGNDEAFALAAQSANGVLREKIVNIDETELYICTNKDCGTSYIFRSNSLICNKCGQKYTIAKIPHGFKTFNYTLNAMGVKINYNTN